MYNMNLENCILNIRCVFFSFKWIAEEVVLPILFTILWKSTLFRYCVYIYLNG